MNALQLVGYFQDFQLTWSYFLDQLVAGLTLGSIYGLIAIGYSMVYGILKLLNFAHGEVFMIGSYIGFFVLTWLGGAASPNLPIAIVIALMFAAAMIGSGLSASLSSGLPIDRFERRRLLASPPSSARSASRSACSSWRSSVLARRRSSTTRSRSIRARCSRGSRSVPSRSSTCSSSSS